MPYPGYQLNPGDMFQVEPDSVMFATGKIKTKIPEPQGPGKRWTEPKRKAKNAKKMKEAGAPNPEEEATDETAPAPEADEGSLEPDAQAAEAAEDAKEAPDVSPELLQRRLRFLARKARSVLRTDADEMGAKQKQRIRAFMKHFNEVSAKLGRKDGEKAINGDLVATIVKTLKEMVAHDPKVAAEAEKSGAFTTEEAAEAVEAAEAAAEAAESSDDKDEVTSKDEDEGPRHHKPDLSPEEEKQLAQMVREYEDNPIDDSKPYRTPWEPRPYMSAFAFIPRYLEVNQNICAAVYLRHPVARQGMAEVPSPFPPAVQELAFNWYLRRR